MADTEQSVSESISELRNDANTKSSSGNFLFEETKSDNFFLSYILTTSYILSYNNVRPLHGLNSIPFSFVMIKFCLGFCIVGKEKSMAGNIFQ